MNDPFDSMIGFSSDVLLQEIIQAIIIDYVKEDTTKALIETVLEYKALGKIAEFIVLIKELQGLGLSVKLIDNNGNDVANDSLVQQFAEAQASKRGL
jgi:hypothetical protein